MSPKESVEAKGLGEKVNVSMDNVINLNTSCGRRPSLTDVIVTNAKKPQSPRGSSKAMDAVRTAPSHRDNRGRQQSNFRPLGQVQCHRAENFAAD